MTKDERAVCHDPRCGFPNIRGRTWRGVDAEDRYHLEEDHGPYPREDYE